MTNNNRHIAEPFSNIFTDWAEAEWAFDLLRETIRRLRVRDPYDTRVAVTLPQRSGRYFLHLNFGGWLVLGFRGPGQQPERADIALLANSVTWDERFFSFSYERKEGEPEVRGYQLPLTTLHPMTTDLEHAFFTTLDFIADKFQSWKKSTRWKHHNPEIIEACFDPEKRALLLAGGLDDVELRYDRHFTAFHYELAEESEEYVVGGGEDTMMRGDEKTMPEQGQNIPCFSAKTFKLLEGLHHNPTKNFYESRKADFELHLEKPFKELFHRVAILLSPQITEMMETEKRLFSRITKNDFGQGGAWDFYWAAFYPKGGKRTSDAQLSMVITSQHLEFGFSIGELSGESRQQFLQNCEENYDALLQLLPPVFGGDKALFGRHDEIVFGADGKLESKNEITSWQEWLQKPSVADFDTAVVFSKQDILQFSRDKLLEKIVDTYTRFFPLVLLTTLDNPLPAIREYLTEFNNKLPITNYQSHSVLIAQSPNRPISTLQPPLPLSTIAEQTGLDETDLARWVRAIERKGQAVLYGPPGTGKTFVAEKLAAHLVGGGDGFVDLVQFHPAYAYEDFIQGIRPQSIDGHLSYPNVPGRFLEFCRKAEGRDGLCVLIIDEINRANLSRVFGELMYLLEYRNRAIPLAGGGQLKIPQNVRLIGTMNTADRSIALVDHALRRRFAFIELEPNFNALRHFHQQAQTNFSVDALVRLLTRLNQEIGDPHYAIGITFFLHKNLAAEIADIWQMEIEPYLQEYFFDQPEKVDTFRWQAVSQELDLADL